MDKGSSILELGKRKKAKLEIKTSEKYPDLFYWFGSKRQPYLDLPKWINNPQTKNLRRKRSSNYYRIVKAGEAGLS